ncbi:hypothetical protein [Rhodococcus jostii]|uniref:Uncharacterized protein n=1 Tax=Rhodococcus jostii TaxID=132919 RepID=A0A1H4TMB0_RHOJO|nr:hypothetical protein [Rhodococcus jostii]SEC57646.1 hypothetical protein SAMN04490220_1999 [Rhodococcus jostii]
MTPRIDHPHYDDPNPSPDDDPIRWPDPSPLDLWWQRVMSGSPRRRTRGLPPRAPEEPAAPPPRGLRAQAG